MQLDLASVQVRIIFAELESSTGKRSPLSLIGQVIGEDLPCGTSQN